MAKGYWIVSVDVSNPESYKLYLAEKRVMHSARYGARFLIRGGKREVVEGTGRPQLARHVFGEPNIRCVIEHGRDAWIVPFPAFLHV